MQDTNTAVSNVIPFRSAKLLLVDQAGEPYVAMKPIVEGMGLAWQAQHAKLSSGRFSSVITMIVTTGVDGKKYEMACLPLKKLPGWLMSIHASKVRHDLRGGVIAYQNECDDALWAYWNEGHAVNARGPVPITDLVHTVIGTSGEMVLDQVIEQKGTQIPSTLRRSFKQTMKSRLRTRFNVQKTALIPSDSLADACNFIVAYNVEGEWIPRDCDESITHVDESGLPARGRPGDRIMVSFNHQGQRQITEIPADAYVLSQLELIQGMVAMPADIMVDRETLFDLVIAAVMKLKVQTTKH